MNTESVAYRGLSVFADMLESNEIDNSRYHSPDGIILFTEEILGIELKPYQARILRAFVQHRRVAVYAGRDNGKTAIAAIAVLWLITIVPGEVKIITTASNWTQLAEYLWPEIHKWAHKGAWDKVGVQLRRGKELLERNIRIAHNKRAFAASPDKPEGIEGAHAETVACIFDESHAISSELFDSVEGTFAGADEGAAYKAYALAISRPGAKIGRFYEICAGRVGYRHWHVDHITLEEAIEAGQVSAVWAEQQLEAWGADSAHYVNHVLGEFADESERSLFRLSWIEAANERWRMCDGKASKDESGLWYASDVADMGNDQSTTSRMSGKVIEYIRYWNIDPLELAEKIRKEIGPNTKPQVAVDTVGVGTGTYYPLKKWGYRPVKFKGSYRTDETDISGELKFLNLRTASYWRLRDALDPESLGYMELALPPDERLERELMAMESWEQSGVIRISDKEKDLRPKLGGKSPDGADTLAMLIWVATKKRTSKVVRL